MICYDAVNDCTYYSFESDGQFCCRPHIMYEEEDKDECEDYRTDTLERGSEEIN